MLAAPPSAVSRGRRWAAAVCAAGSLVAFGLVAAVAISGGVNTQALGLRLRSTDPLRPLVVAVTLAVAAWWSIGGRAGAFQAAQDARRRTRAWHGAAALALLTAAVSAGWNSWTASGPDAFAYVSQAALWRRGHLRIDVPLAVEAPWPNAIDSFKPFGYRPAANGSASLVPTTSAGLPMLMAAMQAGLGHWGAFLITPLSGAVAVWLTFLMGQHVFSARAGLIAAWLLATSPAFLFMLMWPMTDVPAVAVTAAALLCLLRPGVSMAVLAGAICGFGILLRPNFIVIAFACWGWLAVRAWRTAGRGRLAAFSAGLLPGVIAAGYLNWHWHGSPVSSGYGADAVFSIAFLPTNLARYGWWMLSTAPAAVIGLAALTGPFGLWRDDRATRLLFAAIVAATMGVYLLYEPWPYWWYLRFFLPAWPVLFLAAAAAFAAMSTTSRGAAWMAGAIVLCAGAAGVGTAATRDVFRLGVVEHRYAAVARFVDTVTEADAVILTTPHSGSLRYYAGRETLRYDLIDPAWLDRAVAWLAARGRPVYVLLEDGERDGFERRFAGSVIGRLDYPPAAAWQSRRTPGWIYLFAPGRRDAITAVPGDAIEAGLPRIPLPAAQWAPWR